MTAQPQHRTPRARPLHPARTTPPQAQAQAQQAQTQARAHARPPAQVSAQVPTQVHAEAPVEVPAWHVLDEVAEIRFLPSGLPLALRWRGCLWQVIGEPASWTHPNTAPGNSPDNPLSELENPGTAQDGQETSGLGGQDTTTTGTSTTAAAAVTRFWRFQAQTGPASPVLEFDMNTTHTKPRHPGQGHGHGHNQGQGQEPAWRLRRVAAVTGY